MSSFLYFVPTPKSVLLPDDFNAVGLGYALHRLGMSCVASDGPGGAKGVLATTDLPGKSRHGFDPKLQTWRSGPGGKWHVGYWNAQKPGPADLLREQVYEGQEVQLLDGNGWIVPRCVGVLENREGTLPYMLSVADDGVTIVPRVHGRYEKLCRDAFDYYRFWCNAVDARKWTIAELTEFAVAALMVNYRIGLIETVAVLELLGEMEISRVARAAIDADEIEAWVKSRANPVESEQKKTDVPI